MRFLQRLWRLTLPLWLDSIGTCIGGCLGGPIIGAICGAANNLIYGFTAGDNITLVYALTSLGIDVAAAVSIPLVAGRLWLFLCFIAVSLCVLASGRILKRTFPLIAFSFTILLTIFLIHGLFNQRNTTVLFSIGPLHFYKEGLLYVLRIGLNIFNMLLSFAILVLSTKPAELVEELEKRGFSQRFGYIINSVFQIIPQMMGTMNTITDAQRSRVMETEGSLLTRAKAFIPLISPVVMSSLINTRERAIALEVRGFGAKAKKTYLGERIPHRGDRVITVVLLLFIVLAIVWRIVECLY